MNKAKIVRGEIEVGISPLTFQEDQKTIPFSLPIKRVPEIPTDECLDLADKIVLITGGSRGIGASACERFVKAGCRVIGTSRYPTRYQKPKNYEMKEMDVRSDESVKACIDAIVADYGHIDILVNNAGIGQFGRLIKARTEHWIDLFQTNLFGQHRVTVAAYDHMLRADTRVITIGSLEGSLPVPYMSIYGISKRALAWWSMLFALEQRHVKPGPTFSVLEPSYVASTFADKEQVANYVHTEPDSVDKYVKLNAIFFPMAIKRGMSPESVADAIYRIACSKEPRQQYFIDKEHERIIGIGKSIDELLTLIYTQPIEKTMKLVSEAVEYAVNKYGTLGSLLSLFR